MPHQRLAYAPPPLTLTDTGFEALNTQRGYTRDQDDHAVPSRRVLAELRRLRAPATDPRCARHGALRLDRRQPSASLPDPQQPTDTDASCSRSTQRHPSSSLIRRRPGLRNLSLSDANRQRRPARAGTCSALPWCNRGESLGAKAIAATPEGGRGVRPRSIGRLLHAHEVDRIPSASGGLGGVR